MKKIIAILILFLLPVITSAATLSLSPSSQSVNVGDTFSVIVNLDTQGTSIDGIDLRYLSYNPAILQLQDGNISASGIQITPGSLMPMTLVNSADTNLGRITFSQATSGGNNTRSGFPRNLLRDPCRKVWKPLVSIIRLEGMAVKKTHHNAYTTHYHFVFPVKYRKALLNGDIPLAINRLAEEIANRYDIEFEKIGYDNDHIHILASFPPKHSGSEVVRIFKSITARELFKQFPMLKKDLWGGEFWSDGFYMATVSERGNWSVVEQYVASQGKTKEELRQPHLFA